MNAPYLRPARLGFHLSRTGRTFRITDKASVLAVNSTAAMSLEDIERWIGEEEKRL
jgi:hypothetical protein